MSGIRDVEDENVFPRIDGDSAHESVLRGGRAEALMRRILDGDATWRVLNGTAGTVDLKVVSRLLVDGCEAEINEAIIMLAECHDLTSDDAKKAHFSLRVNGEILRRLNDIVKIGAEARQKAMMETDDE